MRFSIADSPTLTAIMPILILGWFLFVLFILSLISGWHQLGQRYRARHEPAGIRFGCQSAKIGGVRYNKALIIIISEQGFYIAPWKPFQFAHPPLLIPWREIYNVTFKKAFWMEAARFEVSRPPFATFVVRKKIMEAARPYLAADALST